MNSEEIRGPWSCGRTAGLRPCRGLSLQHSKALAPRAFPSGQLSGAPCHSTFRAGQCVHTWAQPEPEGRQGSEPGFLLPLRGSRWLLILLDLPSHLVVPPALILSPVLSPENLNLRASVIYRGRQQGNFLPCLFKPQGYSVLLYPACSAVSPNPLFLPPPLFLPRSALSPLFLPSLPMSWYSSTILFSHSPFLS